jgi:hypothetical protein
MEKSIVKFKDSLWLLSVDETGGIAKLPLKYFTSVLVDTYHKRFLCTIADKTWIVDLWGCDEPLIKWSGIVKQVAICLPYLVAEVGNHIEIRNMFSSKIV